MSNANCKSVLNPIRKVDRLVVNSELFLSCFGHCSGCPLTLAERSSKQVHFEAAKRGLTTIYDEFENSEIQNLIVGFGRGNLLNLPNDGLAELAELMNSVRNSFRYENLIFEVSTSLVGKLDSQISVGAKILDKSDVFFNVVVNSEITSPSFWKNLNSFLDAMTAIRLDEFGMRSDNGDIVTINVNPKILPDLKSLKEVLAGRKSPINFCLFPPSPENAGRVESWTEELWNEFAEFDMNVKNFLTELRSFDSDLSLAGIKACFDETRNTYRFVSVNGDVIDGSLSIIGEIDSARLMARHSVELDFKKAKRNMQINPFCASCEHQFECLMSGSYVNLLANPMTTDRCPSGYGRIFQLAARDLSSSR